VDEAGFRVDLACPREHLERDRLTFLAWGAPLDPAGYLERERRLRAHAFARAGLRGWLLRRAGDECVLASCETYRMPSRAGGTWSQSFAVASVFTEPALRGHGYASLLMRLLTNRLRVDAPDAHAIALYSDVGAPIYARVGYTARQAQELVLPAEPGDPGADGIQLVAEPALPELHRRLAPPADRFLIWPTPEQLDWHLERARIYGQLLGREPPAVCGAYCDAAAIAWAADLRSRRLRVLLVQAETGEQARLMLRAAARVAAAHALSEVRAWWWPGLCEVGFTVGPREGSLPMLLPLAPGVAADDWRWIPRALWV
jgi:GNAT superfamily N-acetyltransferase